MPKKIVVKRGAVRKKGPRRTRKKQCKFCLDHVTVLNYKEVSRLHKSLTERGKIVPSRISGNCAKHQRMLSSAVKRARFMALIPYVEE
jgi:small subunit ribosomal protein S18